MISRNVINPLLLCFCLLCPPLAHADTVPPVIALDSDDKPLLIIRFNQKHVFFDNAVAEAERNVEKLVPEGIYVIASSVPPLRANRHVDQDDSIADEQVSRIRAVINQLQALGVSTTRIRATNQVSNSVSNQEIRIFIK